MGFRFLVVCLTLFFIFIHFNLCEGCIKKEREALLQFKHSINSTYNPLVSWVGEDCCKWVGVGCNNITWHVVELNYSYGLVISDVSPSFTELKYLEHLDLSDVDFAGREIPKFFGNFTRLRYLNLYGANFSGPIPSSLGNLSELEILDLSNNQLTGPIPSSLGELSALTHLQLSENQLTGPIPSSLGKLSALKELWLSENQITGPFPSSLGELSVLEHMHLDSNRLSGVVSEVHFRLLSSLVVLDMNSNFLIFNMSSSWKPPFQLEELHLQSCHLGPTVPQWLGTQIHLTELHMSNTSISEVSTWFWNFTSRLSILDLSSNQIHGPLPILQHNASVDSQALYLGSNFFEGPLPQFPSNVDFLYLPNNFISGPISENITTEMPTLSLLVLSYNNINGSIPASLCKLKNFYYIDMSNNHLSGIVPDCWKVSSSIELLKLTSNNLTGLIPSSFGNVLSLQSLHLSNNKFYGEIPESLRNCSQLEVLDLGNNNLRGNIPSWLGEMSRLGTLSLRSNNFGGTLSPRLCHLNVLQILDLSQNHLSGTIPPCVYNFSGMKLDYDIWSQDLKASDSLIQVIKGISLEYTLSLRYLVNFDLSSNNIVGHIPEGIVLLDGIKSLNLSNNQLTGEIPMKIGNLTSLESLDFSKNLLCGTIPESMSDLGSLGAMNLSYNNLSGKIPTGHQLQTFGASSYTGNIQLCGYPIEKNCSPDASSKVIDQGKLHGGYDRSIEFYISLAIGIVAGFWGFCAVLLFKKTWRNIYFQFVERMHDQLLLTIELFVLRLKRKVLSD